MNRSIKYLFGVLITILFTMPLFGQKDLVEIGISLSEVETRKEDAWEIRLSFEMTNNHKKKQKVCDWMTPFEGFKGDFFEVKDKDGNPISYKGIKKKDRNHRKRISSNLLRVNQKR